MLTQAHRHEQWCALIANGYGNAQVLTAHDRGDIQGLQACVHMHYNWVHGDHALNV